MPLSRRSILVAVADDDHSWATLDWAIAEATARRSALRIVHAINWPLLTLDLWGWISVNWRETSVPEAAQRLLDNVASWARDIAPSLDITVHLQHGALASAIGREVRDDDALIVLGRSRPRDRSRWMVRAVSRRVVRHAHVPVVVVESA